MAEFFDTPGRAILTYNLKNGAMRDFWNERKPRMVEVIQDIAPTFFGTQEGFDWQLKELDDALLHYDMIGAGREADGSGEFAAIFIDRRVVSVEDSGNFWLSSEPDTPGSIIENDHLPRVATWARLRIGDVSLLYINTHLTYMEENIPVQMQHLVERLPLVLDDGVDTVITGDFNIGRHREPMKQLNTLGFVDAWSFAERESGPRFTFPDWKPWEIDEALAITEENRIDWIAWRPRQGGELPRGVEIATINTHTHEPVPSDHFPVVLRSLT